ncbi:MAG: hypothetical protein JWM74_3258 [Myxococcaceae bacterium]|nr:hypothetical protein [Myxococcaceae bacterium]
MRLVSSFSLPLLVVLASLTASPRARAANPLEDLRGVPETIRPPTLPDLTHRRTELTLEVTGGTITPRDASELRGHVPITVLRAAIEVPITTRRWFAGASYITAYGNPATAEPMRFLGGNTELYARAVWATRIGLTFGGGIGAVLPTASYDRERPAVRGLATGATALRPWDISMFEEGSLALRPFLDMRYAPGRLVLQLRQSFDGSFDVRTSQPSRIFAVTTAYVGCRFVEGLVLGVEAYELYLVDAPVADERRAFFTVAPTAHFDLDGIEPSISVLTNLGPPYLAGTERLWALRMSVTTRF